MVKLFAQFQNCILQLVRLYIFFFGELLKTLLDDSDFLKVGLFFFIYELLKQTDSFLLLFDGFNVECSFLAVALHFKLQLMIREIQESIDLAKIAEQTQRYEDMVKYVRQIIKMNKSEKYSIRQEQVKLFSNAYKCKINSRRTAWRALEILYSKEVSSKNRSSTVIQLYKDSIEKEIREICQQAISSVDSIMKGEKVKTSIKLQLYKMRGDFHRYLCEISKDQDQLKKYQKQSENTYKKGIEQLKNEQKREKELKDKKQNGEYVPSYDSRRLAIYLNLSVFYYEIMSSLSKAIETCEEGFNSALENISDLQQAKYIDSVTIMQLMHDNITAWKTQKERK